VTGPEPGVIDPLEDAKAELVGYRIMSPEDLMENLSPNACLFFTQQAAYTTVSKWVEALSPTDGTDEYEETDIVKAFYALTAVCGMLDQACVLVGILSPEAIELPASVTAEVTTTQRSTT